MQKFSRKLAKYQQMNLKIKRMFAGLIFVMVFTLSSISAYAAPVLITLIIGSDGSQLILSCQSSAGDHFILVHNGEVSYPEFPPGYAHQRCVEEGYPDGY